MMHTNPQQRRIPALAGDSTPQYPATHDLLRDQAAFPLRQAVPLSSLRLDGGTQARVAIATLVVDEYAAAMRTGAVFPPIVVFRDGTAYWVADGFHRVYAARQPVAHAHG